MPTSSEAVAETVSLAATVAPSGGEVIATRGAPTAAAPTRSFSSTTGNTNTIELSMMPQLVENGDTPPTLTGSPRSCGEPPITASMWGTAPGSWSVTMTANRENMSTTHAFTALHFAALTLHAGIV